MPSLFYLVLLLPAALALPSFVKIYAPCAAHINTTGSIKLVEVNAYTFAKFEKIQKLFKFKYPYTRRTASVLVGSSESPTRGLRRSMPDNSPHALS
jgi:hypothetical protein